MNKIIIKHVVTTAIPLLREPTQDELEYIAIKESNIFDIEGLFDFEKSTVIEEDFSFCKMKIIYDNKGILYRPGEKYDLNKEDTNF